MTAPPVAAVPLRPIERALGRPVGFDRDVAVLAADGSVPPGEAFEATVLEALRRPPCLVSFSGGRDSSAILAVATTVARREGLPLPVPATLEFPEHASAHETEWQTRVLTHLGLVDRLVFPIAGDDFDAVGPQAQHVMRLLGHAWPFNLHFHNPILEAARGGALLTGFGGDEVANSARIARAERLLARRRVTRPRDVATIALRVAPAPVRYLPELQRAGGQVGNSNWLSRRGRVRARSAFAASAAAMPLGWGRLLRRWVWRSRYFRVVIGNFAALGAHGDVVVRHPFVEAPVLASLAAYRPFEGVGGRQNLLRLLAGGTLPSDVVQRTSKATFSGALWTDRAREFATEWDGSGLDDDLLDREAVRRAWLARAGIQSAPLMQQAWLAAERARVASAGLSVTSGPAVSR